MAARGFSRGAPRTLTKSEQEDFIRTLEENPTLRDNISTITGREYDSLTFGEKLQAFNSFQESGRAAQVAFAAGRAHRDLGELARQIREEATLSDQVAELTHKLEQRDTELLAAREAKAEAEDQLRQERDNAVSKRARAARAVNSGEKVPA